MTQTICKNCGNQIKKVHSGSGHDKEYRHMVKVGFGLLSGYEYRLQGKSGCTNPEPKEIIEVIQ